MVDSFLSTLGSCIVMRKITGPANSVLPPPEDEPPEVSLRKEISVLNTKLATSRGKTKTYRNASKTMENDFNALYDEHCKLKDKALKVQESYHQSQKELHEAQQELLVSRRENWRLRYATTNHERIQGKAHAALSKQGDEAAVDLRDLRIQLAHAEDRVSTFQSHILKQQRDLEAASSSADLQTDEEVRRSFQDLFMQIHTWAFRLVEGITPGSQHCDYGALLDHQLFMPFILDSRSSPVAEKKYIMHVVVNVISIIMLELRSADVIYNQQVAAPLHLRQSLVQVKPAEVPFKVFNNWKRTSRAILSSLDPTFFADSRRIFADFATGAAISTLALYTGVDPSPQQMTRLHGIFANAYDFFEHLQCHPAGYTAIMVDASNSAGAFRRFVPDWHEDIGGVDDDADAQWLLCGFVFPAMVKCSDEDGNKIKDIIISKAKVTKFKA